MRESCLFFIGEYSVFVSSFVSYIQRFLWTVCVSKTLTSSNVIFKNVISSFFHNSHEPFPIFVPSQPLSGTLFTPSHVLNNQIYLGFSTSLFLNCTTFTSLCCPCFTFLLSHLKTIQTSKKCQLQSYYYSHNIFADLNTDIFA